MAQQVGIRQYLKSRGYTDEDIGWDPTRKEVTLQGKDFYGATPSKDGYTYGTAADLDAALNRYRGTQQQDQTAQYGQQVPQALKQYQTAATAQPFQYTPYQPFNYTPETDPAYQAALRTAQTNAKSATGNALVALGSLGIGNSASAVRDANSIQQQSLGQVTDQALPQLLAQAYQRYNDAANRDLRTQEDTYGVQQDRVGNLSNLVGALSGLNQQGLDNQYRNDQAATADQQRQIALNQWYTDTYGVNINPLASNADAYSQVANMTPLDVLQEQQREKLDNAQLGISRQNAANSQNNTAYNQFMDLWQRTGSAPYDFTLPNGYTVKKGETFPQSNASTLPQKQVDAYNELFDAYTAQNYDPVDAYNFAVSPQGKKNALDYGLSEGLYNQLVDQLKSRIPTSTPMKASDYKTNPDFAEEMQEVLKNPVKSLDTLKSNAADFINKYGYDGYQALLNSAQGY